jgi:hypothetical protein
MGLRALAKDTGGLAVMNRNSFSEGLQKIVDSSDGYYLLAYTPTDNKFKGDFRKIEIKLKRSGDGWRVQHRRGYMAREDQKRSGPATREEGLLAAIQSPLARRDIDVNATLLYKSAEPTKGAIDIHLSIQPGKVQFETVGDKQAADLDVAGFVFDELGKLRGGFSETIQVRLSPQEFARIKAGGLAYSANTTLPNGAYQIRIAVRDNKNGNIGTSQRYLEVPDLTKGRLSASSLLLGAASIGSGSQPPVPLAANGQVSRSQDLRYAVIVYNGKQKDGKSQVRSQLSISQNGKVLFTEPEALIESGPSGTPLTKVGQLALGKVPPGRYTMSVTITDQEVEQDQSNG